MANSIEQEIGRRRTFAIISHPDAGKTTLTEKFLLYGGAINTAGSVKGKANSKHAVSDWMEIEKERGISVTSSVLQFEYEGKCINILDTPGHEDFSEDTYRTLMAADCAVMVIDASKGVEPQTIKLFKEFKGVYERASRNILRFEAVSTGGAKEAKETIISADDDNAADLIGEDFYENLMEEIELLDGAAADLDMEKVHQGKLSPVFFGSALTNFGVEPFLEHFLKMTNRPLARTSKGEEVDPVENGFSAFVFKIQANMNKNHRDRIAFMRICSGKFEANMEVKHVQSKKKMRLSQPQQIMAQERKIVEEAYAGDIIGVFDPGIFSIGDTVCLPKDDFEYEGIPTFAPEHFARVIQLDSMKRKQFVKGVEQIAQEGAIQIFQEHEAGFAEIIVGVVGTLQFDVLKYRLENEYNCEIRLEPLPYQAIRWIKDRNTDMNKLRGVSEVKKVKDMRGNPLLLFKNEWGIQFVLDRNEGLELVEFSKE